MTIVTEAFEAVTTEYKHGIRFIEGNQETAIFHSQNAFKNHHTLTFHISNDDKLEGKIQLKLTEYQKELVLLEHYTDKDKTVDILKFIGQRRPPNKNLYPHRDLTIGFQLYSFVSQGKQYLLLSEQELPTGNCNIEGMVVHAKYDSTIIAEFKLVSKIPLYFAHTIKLKPREINKWADLIQELKTSSCTHERLMDYLAYHEIDKRIYRQHPLVETLDLAWILSAPIDGYSPGRIRIGDPSTGKTKWAHAIHQKYNESQSIVDGSTSTIKGLVPSFKSTPPSPGALLNSQRLLIVDEFFRMLGNSTDEESRRELLGKLNSLIDRVTISFTSGNGTIKGKMSGKFYTNTNPVYGTSSLPKLLFWLDQAFLSRCIPEYIGPECIEWVKCKNHEHRREPEWRPDKIKKLEWTDFTDCAEAHESGFDEMVTRSLVKKLAELTNDDMTRSFLRMRMEHHAACLMDGIVKVRCIKELDPILDAKVEDYQTFCDILAYLGDNWNVVSNIGSHRVRFGEALRAELDTLLLNSFPDRITPRPPPPPEPSQPPEGLVTDFVPAPSAREVKPAEPPAPVVEVPSGRDKVMMAVQLILSKDTPVDEAWFLDSIASLPDRQEWVDKLITEGIIYRPKPGMLLLL